MFLHEIACFEVVPKTLRIYIFYQYCATWLNFGIVLAPTGFWRGPQIFTCWTNHNNMKKNEVHEWGLEKHDLLIDFRCQNEMPEMVKKRFSVYTCCNLIDVGGQETWSKIEVQNVPTSHQHWNIGHPRCDSFETLVVFGKLVFLMFWGAGKRWAKK